MGKGGKNRKWFRVLGCHERGKRKSLVGKQQPMVTIFPNRQNKPEHKLTLRRFNPRSARFENEMFFEGGMSVVEGHMFMLLVDGWIDSPGASQGRRTFPLFLLFYALSVQ